MDEFTNDMRDFVLVAVHNGTRAALQASKAYPVVDGVMIVKHPDTNELLGARVFFVEPTEPAWVMPNGTATYGDYDQRRKDQAPLTATFYVVNADDIGSYEDVAVYRNTAQ